MGHAVYSISDPRAIYSRDLLKSWLWPRTGVPDFCTLLHDREIAPEVIARERPIYKGVSANFDL
jgi:citrate synthase